MKLGWKRSPEPAPTGAAPSATAPLPATAPPSATAPLPATAPSSAALSATAPLPATAPSSAALSAAPSATAPLSAAAAPSAEPCRRRCIPRIRRTSYWVRSSLITDTSVVCSNCGQPLDPARANGH